MAARTKDDLLRIHQKYKLKICDELGLLGCTKEDKKNRRRMIFDCRSEIEVDNLCRKWIWEK